MSAGESKNFRASHRTGLVCLGLTAATLAVYWQVAGFPFTNYDDDQMILGNPYVLRGLTLEGLWWGLTTWWFEYWHPVTWWSHMLDCELFGLNAGWHHLVNLAFHVANSLLVFVVLKGMTGAWKRSALVAALFALHPLHVESVVWVAERKDVLSAFFFLLTLWAYGRYAEGRRQKAASRMQRPKAHGTSPGSSFRPPAFYLLSLFFFALGLMSKPMVVTLPFVLLLLDCWPLQRLTLNTQPRTLKSLFPLLLEKIPFFAMTAGSCVITYAWAVNSGNTIAAENIPWGLRLANVPVSYAMYLGKAIWPADLAVVYPMPSHWAWWQVGGAVAVLALLTMIMALRFRSAPYGIVGWLIFLGMLFPTLRLVQGGAQFIADRYTYLPLIGLSVALVWSAADQVARVCRPARSRSFRVAAPRAGQGGIPDEPAAGKAGAGLCHITVWALACGGLLACAAGSWAQLRYWRDTETLFRHALAVTRGNYIAHNNFGTALDKQGRLAEAAAEFRKAIAVKPDYARAYNNLGVVLGEQGQAEEAIAHYRKAIELQSSYAEPHHNLGLALSQQGRLEEAKAQFERALALRPDYADARYHLALALARAGRLEEAIAEYRKALMLQPGSADLHNNLGVTLDQAGRAEEAAAEYREAIRLKPDYARAYFNLGVTLGKGGRVNEAIAAFEQALKLQPDYPAAQRNLAQLLELKRSPPK